MAANQKNVNIADINSVPPGGEALPLDIMQSLARVLRQLIDNGYIEQKTGHSDRRQRLLHATDKGRQFFATLSATQASRITAAIAALPPDSRRIVTRFLAGMVDPADRVVLDRLNLTSGL